jgi:hypothetical protein
VEELLDQVAPADPVVQADLAVWVVLAVPAVALVPADRVVPAALAVWVVRVGLVVLAVTAAAEAAAVVDLVGMDRVLGLIHIVQSYM